MAKRKDHPASNDEIEEPHDGMADMMSKILNQKPKKKSKKSQDFEADTSASQGALVPSSSKPVKHVVLSKRKTSMMKEAESEREEKKRLRLLRLEKKAHLERQNVAPDMKTTDFERQLKRLATKGVVALFNAIAKAKRQQSMAESADKAEKEEKNPESQSLSTVRIDNKVKEPEGGVPQAKKSAPRTLAASQTQTGNQTGPGWKALSEDYMLRKTPSLKAWDQEDSDDKEA